MKGEKKWIMLYEDMEEGKTFKTDFGKQLEDDLFDGIKGGDEGKGDEYLHVVVEWILCKNGG
ncbi:hypothetical protein, partial [Bacillus pumilus]|uniref:hypothetical protein n=1 Tax=Bacillus pumilus TaxID=1408 RepID=UPI0011AA7132